MLVLLLNKIRCLWQSSSMDKSSVIQTLRMHELELRAAGIVHLRLFGSVARGESTQESDVDLLAEFDRSKRLTLFGMAHLENQLSDMLGVKVDLSPVHSMKQRVKARAMREAVHAF
jgi:predicted nucleotidyltransferase